MVDRNTTEDNYSYGLVTGATHNRFREALGLPETEGPTSPSLADLRSAVTVNTTDELAEMGRAVTADLSAPLDADLLATELDALEEAFDQFHQIRKIGVPDRGQTPYRELTPAAWRIVDHLAEVGFFTSTERHLPSFTQEHIEATTKQLLQMESLSGTLSTLGLTDDEQLALVTNIVTSSELLSWWEHTEEYPTVEEAGGSREEGVDHEHVAPLHERAMAGSLLWIDGLDWWIWQNEVLISETMLDRGIWDVRSMLAGVYLLGESALGVAEGEISDEDLTTQVTASTAMMIVGQEALVSDVAWIDDDMRKPRTTHDGGPVR